jgi:hypothetical protein
MNELVKPKNLQLALKEEADELAGGGFGQLIKFDANTKKYSFVGGDEIPLGRTYIAHCDQFARGPVKFVDKRPVDIRVKKVGEGKPPKREELDETELAGQEDDPWVFQRYLPLEDIGTNEIVTFVSKSVGAKIALGNLLMTYSGASHRGKPIVKLAIGSFNTADYGRRARPDFAVVGWTGGSQRVPKEIGIGPPEREAGDPSYDPSALSRDLDEDTSD